MSRFDNVTYDEEAKLDSQYLKNAFERLEMDMRVRLMVGRPREIALTKLEESFMWIGKAIRDDTIFRRDIATPKEEGANNVQDS